MPQRRVSKRETTHDENVQEMINNYVVKVLENECLARKARVEKEGIKAYSMLPEPPRYAQLQLDTHT